MLAAKNIFTLLVCLGLITSCSFAQSDKKGSGSKSEDHKFSVADGKYHFVAPGAWKKVKPKFDFYHAEFNIPKVEGDEKDARITFSQVGGTIAQNLQRWVDQFKGLDEGSEDALKKMNMEIDGNKVRVIHIEGTFIDGGGRPFGPKTERENYVLMGAAIETGGGGNVYIKAYGPAKTMKKNHAQLKKMLEGMKTTD